MLEMMSYVFSFININLRLKMNSFYIIRETLLMLCFTFGVGIAFAFVLKLMIMLFNFFGRGFTANKRSFLSFINNNSINIRECSDSMNKLAEYHLGDKNLKVKPDYEMNRYYDFNHGKI